MMKDFWRKIKSLNLQEILSHRPDGEFLERLEERLISADFGVDLTMRLVRRASSVAKEGDGGAGREIFDEIVSILTIGDEISHTIHDPSTVCGPSVILIVGTNGTGKTTTCAKLALRYREQGLSVLLVAADTFRAGAVEQLKKWALRVGCDVVGQGSGADPASVLYDGIQAARGRGIDVVICDTAGRLHTSGMLMEELKKMRRVAASLVPSAPHEVLLVLDATTGQNALRQARVFHEALGLSGIALCKMEGTSKGGIVVSIAHELKVPVKLLGTGEGPGDLVPFEAGTFTSRLLGLPDIGTSRAHIQGDGFSGS